MKVRRTPLFVSVLAASLLTGCNNDNDKTLTGRFVDSPVQGLSFSTPSQSGETNANGEFTYQAGEMVTFAIGNLQLPAVKAQQTVTPLDLFGASSPYNPAVVNLARLLQSLDADSVAENGIALSIPDTLPASVSDWRDSAAIDAYLTVSAKDAVSHLQTSLNSLNGDAAMNLVGRYVPADQQLDKSQAEIVGYHKASESVLLINAKDSTVDILDTATLGSQPLLNPLSASNLTLRHQLDVTADVEQALSGFSVGGINSLAISNDLLAIAVQNDDKQAAGAVAFYGLDQNGTATFQKAVIAGALPDNVVFSADGKYALAANEGEPSSDYTNDPEGSVTLIAIDNGVAADTATQITFSDFNQGGSRASELGSMVRISHPNATVAQDLEPEYIAVSSDSTKAYVAMQENNAVAVIDLATARVDSIWGLGYKDHSVSGNGLDASNKDDAINIRTYSNLYGAYMPDTIASYRIDGVNYLVTANEGDSREYIYDGVTQSECEQAGHTYDDGDCISWIDEARIKDFTLDSSVFQDADMLQDSAVLGRLKAITTEGLSQDGQSYTKLVAFGTRSFSIFNADSGELVFDSGDDFEQTTAIVLGETGFNANNDENGFDNRSDDKGPEPEALAIGKVGNEVYAFIGLERVGGIMQYRITNPKAPVFVNYLTNRDYQVDIANNVSAAGDLAPEGMKFVAAEHSPTGAALLIVGNEVSGTASVYEIK